MLARNAARWMSGGMLVAMSAVALVPSAYAQQAERTYEIAPQSLCPSSEHLAQLAA